MTYRPHIEGPQQFTLDKAIKPAAAGVFLGRVGSGHHVAVKFDTSSGDAGVNNAGDRHGAQPHFRVSRRVGQQEFGAIVRRGTPEARLGTSWSYLIALVIE